MFDGYGVPEGDALEGTSMINRPRASKSTATSGEGISEPDRVHPIADHDGRKAEKVGFMYQGAEYSEGAWIMCDTEDLMDIEF